DGMPRLLCGVATDLTNTIRRSHELAAANARLAHEIEERRRIEDSLQFALGAADMGSWDLDLATDITRRSLRHDQIFGHAELLPEWGLRSTLDRFVREDREAAAAAFAAAQGTGLLDFEGRIIRASDGSVRWLHLKGHTYYDGPRPVRMAGVVADITERREVEAQLRQAQKMEAIGQLTGGVAHDFNNILQVVLGNLDTLRRSLARPPEAPRAGDLRRWTDAAIRGGERAATLTKQLLAFSRRQPLQPQPIDAGKLVAGMSDLLRRTLGETIATDTVLAPELWRVSADPNQLESAILNLAINARDAMQGADGKLTIETENTELDESYTVDQTDLQPGEYVLIAVSDSGIG